MPTRHTAAVSRKALRDGVQEALLEMLLGGHFAPDMRLSIDGLARELEVSPTPVREALAQLEHTGLVQRAALKGYRVAPPLSTEQMSELIEARSVIEVAAAERAAHHASDIVDELARAHARHAGLVEALQRLRRSDDATSTFRRYFEADWAFHLVIMRAAGNRYLLQMLEGLGAHVHRLRQVIVHGSSDAELALQEHAEILAAFQSDDPHAAVAAMRRHLEAVHRRSTTESE